MCMKRFCMTATIHCDLLQHVVLPTTHHDLLQHVVLPTTHRDLLQHVVLPDSWAPCNLLDRLSLTASATPHL